MGAAEDKGRQCSARAVVSSRSAALTGGLRALPRPAGNIGGLCARISDPAVRPGQGFLSTQEGRERKWAAVAAR